jgi:type IV pilus assembly protein PilP
LKSLRQQIKRKKHDKRVLFSVGGMLLAALVISGCSDSPKAPATPVPVKQAPKQPITAAQPAPASTQPQPAKEPEVAYSYNPRGRRDPFMPLVIRDEKKAQKADRPPLERYNITEFKLTGIVWGGFGYNAMFEGPDQKGYFVRVGTIIGQNRGVIKKITKDIIVIEEKFKTFTGAVQRKEIVIELRKKQEGTP